MIAQKKSNEFLGGLLKIENLSISTQAGKSLLTFPHLILNAGEIHAIIGESGSGKSLTLLSIIGLLSKPLQASGSIAFMDKPNLLSIAEKEWLLLRGKSIGMIFQEPMTALNPQQTCGKQLMESARIHGLSPQESEVAIHQKFEDLGLLNIKDRILASYPHQLSGGQRQRVMIAMASLHNPPLMLADEPTTALDSVSRKAVMDDLFRLCKKQGSAVLWVSHEMDLVSQYADSITVLRKGVVLDQGNKNDVLGYSNSQENHQPRNPYVKSLMQALPVDNPQLRKMKFDPSSTVLKINGVSKWYVQRNNESVQAINNLSLTLHRGQTVALVGLSGSGKSTLAKLLVGLESFSMGEIELTNAPIASKPPTGVQMVFQDPYSSLNPNQTAGMALMEIYKYKRKLTDSEAMSASVKSLEEVGLGQEYLNRWPYELSGGQRQRLCIAKALATQPEVLILDESVAALDPLVQKQVLDLLVHLQNQKSMAYLFITHNLHVAKSIAHRIVYLEKGVLGELPSSWNEL